MTHRHRKLFLVRPCAVPAVRLAIFDFDGTLGDTRRNIASSRSSFTLAPLLRDMGLDGTFDAIVCGDGVKHPKPAPDAVLEVLRRMDVPAAEALVVGDMPVDIEMGRAAGVRTCGVLWGNASRDQLAAAGADFIAASMEDIVATLCQ